MITSTSCLYISVQKVIKLTGQPMVPQLRLVNLIVLGAYNLRHKTDKININKF